jgi:hypothetical protein
MAKFNIGDKIIVSKEHHAPDAPKILCTVLDVGSVYYFLSYEEDGKDKEGAFSIQAIDEKYEIVKTVTGYVNVYEDDGGGLIVGPNVHASAAIAKQKAGSECIGRSKVILTKGVFEE